MISRRSFLASTSVIVGAVGLTGNFPAFAADRPLVKVTGGNAQGVVENGSMAFRGLPYAADTSGANRFKAPQPVTPWEGAIDASEYGHMVPQIRSTLGFNDPMFEWYYQPQQMGEDGLVLNVYTPDLDQNAGRPVMFYIHGGGYINGSGGGTGLNGGPLARYGDVVVVTINHRLNAFGYTAWSHLDSENFGDAVNAGHLDIIAALEWVRDNIATFGGDPNNVTLFGQSGGGSKIMSLIAMPGAQGLFHKAISMSGAAGLNLDPQEELQPYADAFLAELGLTPDELSTAQHLTTDFVLDARMRAVRDTFEGARPAIDGKHILYQSMSPEGMALHADVPLMFGHTKTESTLFMRSDMRNFDITEEQMRSRLKAGFGIDDSKVDEIIAGYHEADADMTPSDILFAITSDVQFRLPLTNAAVTRSSTDGQAPVWIYNFAWEIPRDDGELGSPHAVDIPFAFGTLDAAGAMIGTGDAAHETALNMMSAFVAFARNGDPNNDRLPEWLPYNGDTRISMLMQAEPVAASDWRGAGRDAVSDLVMDPFNRASLWRYQE
ncbi:carboxylesterase/lipase family protein [Roseibium aggregatum]|uniref:Carboxylic ester hydrolase n=1 Tax=Roseibium aggregatum TaxID=187304 RepID=A0A939EAM5_9HYPH|nr:carboxylesterase family protein [Roseibium aggregatum]MBN9669886.1 carboxylesterase/lipase family protein [Roseibium aggregatum]